MRCHERRAEEPGGFIARTLSSALLESFCLIIFTFFHGVYYTLFIENENMIANAELCCLGRNPYGTVRV